MWGVKQSALGLKIRGMDRLSPSIGILIAALLCLATHPVARHNKAAIRMPIDGERRSIPRILSPKADCLTPHMCSLPFLQLVKNHRPELRDAARAHGQDHVAVLRDGRG